MSRRSKATVTLPRSLRWRKIRVDIGEHDNTWEDDIHGWEWRPAESTSILDGVQLLDGQKTYRVTSEQEWSGHRTLRAAKAALLGKLIFDGIARWS